MMVAARFRCCCRGILVVMFGVAWLSVLACAARGPLSADQSVDGWITTEVRRRLAENSHLDAEEIRVETRDGVVVLSGVQFSLEQVARALEVAARVPRVKQVVNQIRIVPRQIP